MQRIMQFILPTSIALLSGLLFAVMCMIPTSYTIDIGGYDSAYTQGFFDQEAIPPVFSTPGNARWSGADAAIIIPQYAQPMFVTLRLRAPTPKQLTLTANGNEQVYTGVVGNAWQTITVPLRGGMTKPFTVFLSIHSDVGSWQAGDFRQVGVLVDEMVISTAPGALPYIWPAIWVALVSALAWFVFAPSIASRWVTAVGSGIIPIVIALATWHWQWWYPIPTSMAYIGAGLSLLLVVRHAQWLMARIPNWGDIVSWCVMLAWMVYVGMAQRVHVTLAVPGVEKDFRSFASRSDTLSTVFAADPFYNLGYPLVIHILRQLTGMSAFDSARWWAVAIASIALLATWWLARFIVGQYWGAFIIIAVASSSLFTQYALSIGSDMTFTAVCTIAFALLVRAPARPHWYLWAGMLAGVAFLVRHTGIVLIATMIVWQLSHAPRTVATIRHGAWTIIGWGIGAAIQLWINLRDTGQLFFSYQAKNSWLAVYGNMDWGRWGDVPDAISLQTVILNNPIRFVQSWTHNILSLFGISIGEYERATWLRLINFPLNWLSVIGLIIAIAYLWRGLLPRTHLIALLWGMLFVAISAIAFILPRFLLPLTWVAALAATWGIARCVTHLTLQQRIWGLLFIVVLVIPGSNAGRVAVIDAQPTDERDVISYISSQHPVSVAYVVGPDSPLGKYAAFAEYRVYRTLQAPVDIDALCQTQPSLIVWSKEVQPPPPTTIDAQFNRYSMIDGQFCDSQP